MNPGATMVLPEQHDVLAPDGSQVRVLLALSGGSMAHFRLPAGQVSQAVRHRTVAEIWYILAGEGEMWRSANSQSQTTALSAGTCLTIPVGTAFQFRALGEAALDAIAITMPPWPNDAEAEIVQNHWPVQD